MPSAFKALTTSGISRPIIRNTMPFKTNTKLSHTLYPLILLVLFKKTRLREAINKPPVITARIPEVDSCSAVQYIRYGQINVSTISDGASVGNHLCALI